MKWIITTSDLYHHCLPVFFRQWEKHIGGECELVGYKRPESLPDYCTFVSLGEQRGVQYFTDDLHAYFKRQPDFFVWMMEDTFIKGFNPHLFESVKGLLNKFTNLGKFCLTTESMRREHEAWGGLFFVDQRAEYRLSSQPAIWNRDFLTGSMKPGLNPWQWETQPAKLDNWQIVGFTKNVIEHNEGVRKNDIYKLNLDGIEN